MSVPPDFDANFATIPPAVEIVTWTRLPGESSKAFDAFRVYRDLPPRDRSVENARKKHVVGGNGEPLRQLSRGTMERWVVKYKWSARAAAYDDHQDNLRRAVAADELEKLARQNAKLALASQGLLSQRLKGLDPSSISAKDIPAWIRALKDVEKDMRGAPAYRVEMTGPNGGPVEMQHTIAAAAESLVGKLAALAPALDTAGVEENPGPGAVAGAFGDVHEHGGASPVPNEPDRDGAGGA